MKMGGTQNKEMIVKTLRLVALDGFRQSLASEGISARLITDARRRGTTSTYESAWSKWVNWCGRQKVDPH